MVDNTAEVAELENLADIVFGLGHAKQGDFELFEKLLRNIEKFGDIEYNTKVMIATGVVLRGHENKEWVEKNVKDVLDVNFLTQVSWVFFFFRDFLIF